MKAFSHAYASATQDVCIYQVQARACSVGERTAGGGGRTEGRDVVTGSAQRIFTANAPVAHPTNASGPRIRIPQPQEVSSHCLALTLFVDTTSTCIYPKLLLDKSGYIIIFIIILHLLYDSNQSIS